ncbi:hypothetical protein [Micromonospora okii]|uniref:hypothetical protein n=1 Tax=Micromonospora okii TaxID=1182970 RepID=UPI001E336FE1|nr:hypothetical protein [Micromonospora okii]
MRDADLVGLWDSGPYDLGVMESSWLCLRDDGTGWSSWANVGGSSASRLTWACRGEGEVELRYVWTVSGRWHGTGLLPAVDEVDEEGPDDAVVRTRYRVAPDTPPVGPVVTALVLDEPVEFCHRFGLVRRDLAGLTDPTRRTA